MRFSGLIFIYLIIPAISLNIFYFLVINHLPKDKNMIGFWGVLKIFLAYISLVIGFFVTFFIVKLFDNTSHFRPLGDVWKEFVSIENIQKSFATPIYVAIAVVVFFGVKVILNNEHREKVKTWVIKVCRPTAQTNNNDAKK